MAGLRTCSSSLVEHSTTGIFPKLETFSESVVLFLMRTIRQLKGKKKMMNVWQILFVRSRKQLGNDFQTFVEANRLLTRRVIWESTDADDLDDFPRLDMDDLREIASGSYQMKEAVSYTAKHLTDDGKYKISYHKTPEFNNILFIHLQS